ncbi:MAG: hypothetical protein MJ240_00035 [Kiritimatiellae bacterium]|nr:hypothetical protein [Kiritimatiellia bacterium]
MSRLEISFWGWRFNWIVVVAIIVLAMLLGIANNLRVYEEQRIPWTGPETHQSGESETGDEP